MTLALWLLTEQGRKWNNSILIDGTYGWRKPKRQQRNVQTSSFWDITITLSQVNIIGNTAVMRAHMMYFSVQIRHVFEKYENFSNSIDEYTALFSSNNLTINFFMYIVSFVKAPKTCFHIKDKYKVTVDNTKDLIRTILIHACSFFDI